MKFDYAIHKNVLYELYYVAQASTSSFFVYRIDMHIYIGKKEKNKMITNTPKVHIHERGGFMCFQIIVCHIYV